VSLFEAKELLGNALVVTVLTGAGISTDSGIPDFRGPQGVWTKYPDAEKLATLDVYLKDEEIRKQAWQSRLHSPVWIAEPNNGHKALKILADTGKLYKLITQNIDGLHQASGIPESLILEIHATMKRAMCWKCKKRFDMKEVLERVKNNDPDPKCLETYAGAICQGILKSDTISFGQMLDSEVLASAEEAAIKSDLFIAAGTSLSVYPAANLVPIAHNAGARIIIINQQATAFDRLADCVINDSTTKILPELVGSLL
jgi:NAD-dependent deacetylase